MEEEKRFRACVEALKQGNPFRVRIGGCFWREGRMSVRKS